MKLTFDTPKEIVVVKESKKLLSCIEVIQIWDNPKIKEVVVLLKEIGSVKLWTGADYDTIGQWTDQDVINKLTEIYG